MGAPYPTNEKPTLAHEKEDRRAYIEALALALVHDAELYGVVLTIETLPTPGRPLAMGEHQMVVHARLARDKE